ncbi:MAG: CBS domain-containing protein [Novosphingobium sp.]
MKISDCMSRDVRLVSPQDSIQSAARCMAEIDAGILPVSNDDRLIGIVTDRDIAIRGTGNGLAPQAQVQDVMSNDVSYCYDDEDTADLLETMSHIQVRRLPVLNRDKRLVGIVSITDLAAQEAANTGEALDAIARPSPRHSQTL